MKIRKVCTNLRKDIFALITFMISKDMIHGNVAEDFAVQIEESIHDSAVALDSRLPDSVIAHIASVVDHVCVGVESLDSSKSVFNRSPRSSTMLKRKRSVSGWNDST